MKSYYAIYFSDGEAVQFGKFFEFPEALELRVNPLNENVRFPDHMIHDDCDNNIDGIAMAVNFALQAKDQMGNELGGLYDLLCKYYEDGDNIYNKFECEINGYLDNGVFDFAYFYGISKSEDVWMVHEASAAINFDKEHWIGTMYKLASFDETMLKDPDVFLEMLDNNPDSCIEELNNPETISQKLPTASTVNNPIKEDLNAPHFDISGGALSFVSNINNIKDSVLVIPEGVVTMLDNCLADDYYNPVINELILPSTLKRIDDNALRFLSALKKVNFPEGLEYIGERNFNNCELEAISIPKTVFYCMNNFDKTKKVMGYSGSGIEDELNRIPNVIFEKIGELSDEEKNAIKQTRTIYFNNLHKELAAKREETNGLSDFIFEDDDDSSVIWDFIGDYADIVIPDCVEIIHSISLIRPAWKDSIKSIKFGSNVKEIHDDALSCSPELACIELNEGLTLIGNSSFSYCDKLKEIKVPGSVISIGENAFYHCKNLSKVIIAEGVKKIAPQAFYWICPGAQVYIPSSVTSIGEDAFGDDVKLFVKQRSAGEMYAYTNELEYSYYINLPCEECITNVTQSTSTPDRAPVNETPTSANININPNIFRDTSIEAVHDNPIGYGLMMDFSKISCLCREPLYTEDEANLMIAIMTTDSILAALNIDPLILNEIFEDKNRDLSKAAMEAMKALSNESNKAAIELKLDAILDCVYKQNNTLKIAVAKRAIAAACADIGYKYTYFGESFDINDFV